MRGSVSAGRVDNAKKQFASDECELDIDLVALPTSVAYRIRDKLACDQQCVINSLGLGRRASEYVSDELPRLTNGPCLGSEPGANLT
jgi:hypothetical protein